MTGLSAAGGGLMAAINQSKRQENLFARIDANSDGQISPGELGAFRQNLPGAGAASSPDRFAAIDSGGDGAISKTEWQAYGQQRALLRLQEQPGAQTAHRHKGFGRSPEAAAVFNQLDTNQDGVVSPEEWAAAFGSSNSASVPSPSQAPLTSAVNSVMRPVTDAVDSVVQTLNMLI